MRKGILGVVFATTLALGGSGVLYAHGGTYTGPNGGGTPGFSGPVGGGTTGGGEGGQGGGTTPGLPGGQTGGGGGGTTGPSGPGLRPGGGAPARGGGGIGRATPGRSKPKTAERTNDWDWWWELNDEPFLNLKRKVRAEAEKSVNRDTFLGATVSDDVAGLTLTKIRKDIVPTLKLALKDPYFDARSGAVIALGKVGDKTDVDFIDDIKPLLADSNNTVREAAALALGMLGSRDVVPMLFDILEDTPNGRKLMNRVGGVLNRERAFAAVAIGLVGFRDGFADDEAIIERLAKAASSRQGADNDVQVAPAIALGLIKSQAGVPAMKAILADQRQEDYVRAHIAVALGKVGAKDALKQLVDGLTDSSNHVSRSCAIALGLLASPDDKTTVRHLTMHAKSANDLSTRNFCLISLGQIGSPEALAFLAEQLMRGQVHGQTFSALALGVAKFKGIDVDPRIQDLVYKTFQETKSKSEKGAYAIALGLMNYQDARAAIRKELDEGGSQDLKGHACTALGLLGDREALPQIRELVRQRGDVDLRKRAAIALGLLQDPTAVETLREVILESDASKAVLGAATVAMGFIGDQRAVPILADFLTKKQGGDFVAKDTTRAFATVALGFLGDKDDIPLLSNLQRSSNYLAQTASLAELLAIL